MIRSTVIIPVYNQAMLTVKCVQTVLDHSCCDVVVVNDASTDDTPRLLASFGGRIKTITHRVNAGFARSCNDGAALASGEWLVFLNNDTVPQPGWLSTLESYAESRPRAAVVGSRLLYPDDTIQHAGVVICQDGYPRHLYAGFPASHPAVNKSRRFQAVTAACMGVRRSVFLEAGGFDTAFRNGFEDVDFCLRLGQRGHEIHYCAESVVYHLESVSPGRFRRDRENVDLYRERWLGRVQPDDIRYYLEDELIRLSYEGRYPISLEISPRLGTVETGQRKGSVDRLLREQSRRVAELEREIIRLSLELGAHSQDLPELRYQRLRRRIREEVPRLVPRGATVLVISKGDGSLLDFPGRQGWHFPQTERGAYAGHHPASSEDAIAHLETLRAKGADYLVIPAPSQWWLDHYTEFGEYLDTRFARFRGPEDSFLIYILNSLMDEQVSPCKRPKSDSSKPMPNRSCNPGTPSQLCAKIGP